MAFPTAWRCAQAPEAANKTNPQSARVFIEGDSHLQSITRTDDVKQGAAVQNTGERHVLGWQSARGRGMQIEFLTEGEATILRLVGRFATGSDAEYLRAKETLSGSARRKIVVDCQEVPYLDSTALNFLVGLYTMVTGAGGRFAVCGVNQRMSEVLRITHLDQIMPIYADRATALTAVADGEERQKRAEEN